MEHVLMGEPISAEPARITVVSDLEHASADVAQMGCEEALDVKRSIGVPRSNPAAADDG
jgi:hypothetical protein